MTSGLFKSIPSIVFIRLIRFVEFLEAQDWMSEVGGQNGPRLVEHATKDLANLLTVG